MSRAVSHLLLGPREQFPRSPDWRDPIGSNEITVAAAYSKQLDCSILCRDSQKHDGKRNKVLYT
jgi:hypothetical protein